MLDRSFRGNEAFNLLVNNFSDLTSKSSCFLLCSHTEMLFQGAGVAITGMAGRVCYPLLTKKKVNGFTQGNALFLTLLDFIRWTTIINVSTLIFLTFKS
jgi:hypothetical protein